MTHPLGHPTLADLSPFRALVASASAFRVEEATPAEIVEGPEKLRETLRGLPVTSGWICFTDRVELVEDLEALATLDGIVLDAELASSPSESLHLRHLGDGRWRVSRLRTVKDPGAFGSQRTFFMDGDAQWCFRYEVGWDLVDDAFGESVLRPSRARFAGIQPAGRK
jgi:hypothetical protein